MPGTRSRREPATGAGGSLWHRLPAS